MRNPPFTTARSVAAPVILAIGMALANQTVSATQIVDLGAASGFAVLAGSGITVAGAANSTKITGDIGSFPTTTITGLGNVVLNGVNHAGDSVTQAAKHDLEKAYNDAIGRTPTITFGAIHELGGTMLSPGIYNDPSSFGITGILTLDAGGDPNAVWIFQAGSTLTTASGSQVVLAGGALASHVFWAIGSSATLGTGSHLNGTLMAFSDITATTGANVDGHLFALNGAVTLDVNTIAINPIANHGSVPDGGGTLVLCAFGLASLVMLRRPIMNLK